MSLLFVFYLMFVSGVYTFSSRRKHFLMMLISLEFVVLSLFMGVFLNLKGFEMDYFFLMLFLSLSVCEGVTGLALMVSLVRTHGGDYFKIFSILW